MHRRNGQTASYLTVCNVQDCSITYGLRKLLESHEEAEYMVECTEVEQLFLDKKTSKTNLFTSNALIQRATKKS